MQQRTQRTERRRSGSGLWILTSAALALTLSGAGLVVAAGPLGWPGHRSHAGHSMEYVLDHLDVDEGQRAEIEAILRDAFADLSGWRDGHAELIESMTDALLGDPVDRAGLEEIRGNQLARLDASSARLLAALADAAEVLAPEQRAELAEQIGERHRGHVRHGWFGRRR